MSALRLGMGLGSGGGKKASWITPVLPQAGNIVRAWSLRRLIPAYINGNAIRELRSDGGSETDVPFTPAGVISLSGTDAYANVLFDQKGEAGSKLLNSTFAGCPKVFENSAVLKGIYFDGGDKLTMGGALGADTILDAAIKSGEYSVVVWTFCSQTGITVRPIIHRVTAGVDGGYTVLSFSAGKIQSYQASITPIETTVNTYNSGKWTMVAAVVSRANNRHSLYVYAPDKAPEIVNSTLGSASNGSSNLTIGNNAIGNVSLTGGVNDIMIYNTPLSDADIASIYAATSPYYPVSAGAK